MTKEGTFFSISEIHVFDFLLNIKTHENISNEL